MKTDIVNSKTVLGWREWLKLPELEIPKIKAKLDTGARTSALHVFMLEPYQENSIRRVRFGVHPLQQSTDIEIISDAAVFDRRRITDSGGHVEVRYVIQTIIEIGGIVFPAEMTLTNRTGMRFRMLLGRSAIQGRFLVDPAKSYITGRPLRKKTKKKKRT